MSLPRMTLWRLLGVLAVLLLIKSVILCVDGTHSPLLWSVATVLSILSIALLVLLLCTTTRPPSSQDKPPSMKKLTITSYHDELAFHQARMKYAWDWFQYHADQRLKAFNFFLVILGILTVAYGTAMKEGLANQSAMRTYSAFAAVVALCGVVISIAFFIIEVRNVELVTCGRKWLDRLEGGLDMSLRRDDHMRENLCDAIGGLPVVLRPRDRIVTHKVWMRIIYLIAYVGFAAALSKALWGFD